MAGRDARPEIGISAREAEVLTALGDHLTNAEIGARLFISVRTVESHVSSLLRKLGVSDRRGLAAVAATTVPPSAGVSRAPAPAVVPLPSALTPFVGRVAEQAALAAALQRRRLVTAVGPGGVGKTRLAIQVAADLSDRFADGVWFVDLVPVTDPSMLAPTIADVLGLGEIQGRTATETVVNWLAFRQTLLVLDNCEHLLDGVIVLIERLLAGSQGLTVLATSRARLLVPFEDVFSVPGLSVEADDGTPGDAVQLFLGRVAAAGGAPTPDDTERISSVCRDLDGMALAIELAAARFVSLGLDGLEAGLADRLRMLTGGRRIDDRHRSLRSTLDWSFALLDAGGQAVLRRVSVFAAPFSVAAAAAVVAWEPVAVGAVASILAELADQSLLIAAQQPSGTRYRALETIRQYGVERLADTGESDQALSRHVAWSLGESAALHIGSSQPTGGWRAAFDEVADELRAALAWAAGNAEHRAQAYTLALALAELTFRRGMPSESQRRYEQAGVLAADDLARADALRGAAGAAESRHVADEALRLRRAAADAAVRAGDLAGAATDLARNAELIHRAPGLMATPHSPAEAQALIDEGWRLAGTDVTARARLLTAEAFGGASDDPGTVDLVERALSLARRIGDPLAESAALDQLTSVQLAAGDIRAATASAMRRIELLAPLEMTATSGMEIFDSHIMAAECAVAVGDLPAARRLAERLRDLPFYREEGHLATARLIVVTTLAGDWDEAVGLTDRFREGWERAGQPRAGNLRRAGYAAAAVHGLRGDDDARFVWLQIVDALLPSGPPGSERVDLRNRAAEFFDALLLLHRGLPQRAVELMRTDPTEPVGWYNAMWLPWYAALWAESAVLSGSEDAADRIRRARRLTADNPITAAIVDRAEALAEGDRDGLTAAAAALDEAGCRYQWARTLLFLGGAERDRAEVELAAMGATPMVWPPG